MSGVGAHKLLAPFTFCCHIATFINNHPFLFCLFSNAFLVLVDSVAAGDAVYLNQQLQLNTEKLLEKIVRRSNSLRLFSCVA